MQKKKRKTVEYINQVETNAVDTIRIFHVFGQGELKRGWCYLNRDTNWEREKKTVEMEIASPKIKRDASKKETEREKWRHREMKRNKKYIQRVRLAQRGRAN